MAHVDSRDFVLSGIYYSVLESRRCAKHYVACQHSQQTRDVDPMLVHRLRPWPSIEPALVQRLVFARLRSIARWSGSRGSVPGLGGLKETKMFFPHPRVKVSIVGSLRDREVACSASDRQGSNFESCVWRTVSSQSSHHPQEVLLAQFSLYVHKGGLKPDSFHFIWSGSA